MERPDPSATTEAREIRVPADFLIHLRAAVGASSLEAAGRRAGVTFARRLADDLGVDTLQDVPTATFWKALDDAVRERGWGSLRQERIHSGLGAVVADRWIEARVNGGSPPDEPECPFTVGLLGGLLEAVAGAPVGVVETAGSSRESTTCRFAFGAPAATDELGRRTRDGAEEVAALAGF